MRELTSQGNQAVLPGFLCALSGGEVLKTTKAGVEGLRVSAVSGALKPREFIASPPGSVIQPRRSFKARNDTQRVTSLPGTMLLHCHSHSRPIDDYQSL
jgi:hypothetical protein